MPFPIGLPNEHLQRGRFCVEQLYRMCRWYERFKQINEGTQRNATFDSQEDDMLAFFMNCYHLKDWIKNDICNENLNQLVEDYINQNNCLRLCADICIAAKHLEVRHRRFANELCIQTEVHIDESLENPPVIRKWYITTNSGETFDSFDIATQCVRAWVDFFNRHERELNGNPRDN